MAERALWSVHDETAVFSQLHQFRLVSDHLVQKGPTFPVSIDMSIVTATAISTAGNKRFSTGGSGRVATDYVLKAEIGGISGLVAPRLQRSSRRNNHSSSEGRYGASSW